MVRKWVKMPAYSKAEDFVVVYLGCSGLAHEECAEIFNELFKGKTRTFIGFRYKLIRLRTEYPELYDGQRRKWKRQTEKEWKDVIKKHTKMQASTRKHLRKLLDFISEHVKVNHSAS